MKPTAMTKTKQLETLDKDHYLHPASVPGQKPKMIFKEGKGIHVTNTDGDRYIDGISMLWNVNLGHGQKELAEAARQQMDSLAFASSFAGYSNEPAIHLASTLAEWAPEGLNASFFTSGGSESNDTAFKIARFYWQLKEQPQKTKFLALRQGYHGVTIGAGTATALHGFHRFAGTHIPDVLHATPHLTACEQGDRNHPQFSESLRALIEAEGADTIAGIIIEPIQGSGGVYMPPEGYLQAVRDLCDEQNVLMIADEVINGFGRTGAKFAVNHANIVPDLMCLAKGITSGYAQLGAVMIHDDIKTVLDTFGQVMAHGFTYSGHPSACAVALKNLEIIERDRIIEQVQQMEHVMTNGLRYLEERHEVVHLSRNKGLIGAFELFQSREREERFPAEWKTGLDFVDMCFDKKLILRALGGADGKSIVALAPPLIITETEIQSMIERLDDALSVFETKYCGT
ncbi:aspartate aminotransferase family protein [Marinococcus halophilus]|uniref:Aspartate aminotransferase family protein n=1 Tax=Marinococcus halophilus TaxID=1371 RepID=A0A510Y973_MARHA|nr:aspartate aminotransferase family protein [Marinococcus halophilus]GEK59924.1 aspartate aminotransferase family protein [Marinococcus halophilus]